MGVGVDAGALVGEREKRQFADDGYLVLDPGFDPDLLNRALADVGPIYRDGGRGVIVEEGKRIHNAWKLSPAVKELATHPRVLGALETLYERRPLPFQTLNFNVGSEQRPHSDAIHFNSKPGGLMCGVWIALEDIGMDNGPLVYYPGSHKLPEVTFHGIGLPSREESYAGYEDYVEDVVEGRYSQLVGEAGLEARYGTLQKGQAIVWAANLIHGGSPQRDRSLTRHSLVTHYFFEGCRYYTPLRSGRLFTYWRYPEWVVDGRERTRADQAQRVVNELKWRLVRPLQGRLPI